MELFSAFLGEQFALPGSLTAGNCLAMSWRPILLSARTRVPTVAFSLLLHSWMRCFTGVFWSCSDFTSKLDTRELLKPTMEK